MSTVCQGKCAGCVGAISNKTSPDHLLTDWNKRDEKNEACSNTFDRFSGLQRGERDGDFVSRVAEVAAGIRDRFDTEIILVDDGSKDDSLTVMKSLISEYQGLKIVELRSNAGQTAALQAGIDVVISDVKFGVDGETAYLRLSY